MKLLNVALGSLLFISNLGLAGIRVDMTPESVLLRDTLVDDVSGAMAQTVYVYVKNVGNADLTSRRPIAVKINTTLLTGYLYGPDDEGGSAGGPVKPWKVGKIVMTVPLGTYRHCQRLTVHIDVSRNAQATTDGGNVFANDIKTMVAREYGNRRLCFDIPRPIPIPRPLPSP